MGIRASARKEALAEIIRRDVYDASIHVLLKERLAGLTMDAVAQQADVAKGTLYNYFKNKRDLLDYVYSTLFNDMRKGLDKIADSEASGRAKILRIAEHIVREFDESREVFQLLVAELGVHPMSAEANDDPHQQYFLQLYERLIRECDEQGPFRSIPPRALARLLYSVVMGLVMLRMDPDESRPPEQDVQYFLTFLLRDDEE